MKKRTTEKDYRAEKRYGLNNVIPDMGVKGEFGGWFSKKRRGTGER